jgi:hypothetical protein
MTENIRPLLNAYKKKDDDLQVISITNRETGEQRLLIDTDQPVELMTPEILDEPDNLLTLEAESANHDVVGKLVFFVFLVNGGLTMLVAILAFLPYQLLTGSLNNSAITFAVTSFIGALAYGGMALTRLPTHWVWWPRAFFVVWALSMIGAVGSVSALLQDIAPLVAMIILCAQSLVVIIYTRVSGDLSHVHAFLFMMLISLIVWVACIYAFIEEHAWFTGGIALVFGIAGAAYHARQIYRITLSSDMKNKTRAIVEFYTDPFVKLIECCKNNQSDG